MPKLEDNGRFLIQIEVPGQLKVLEQSQSQDQNGYIKEPILNIPFYRVVIDMLHLFLRISDVLYDLFIQDLRNLDGKQKNELDLGNMPHLNQF